jgi:hypothetical protein
MTDIKKMDSLIGMKAFPAISILLPTHTQDAGITTFRERMSRVARNVEDRLESLYSKQKVNGLMSRLNHAINGINLSSTGSGIAIFISESVEKIFHLPFAVSEKVIIDDSFEIRDLLYAARINRSYMLVLISRNTVTTMLGYGKSLVPVEMEGMPENVKDVSTLHSLPGWDYLDKRAYDETNLNKFIHFIDEVVHRELQGDKMPVIIFGDSKILGHYRKTSKISSEALDFIEGNYEHASKQELLKRIEPSLKKLGEEEEKKALSELEQAAGRNQVSAGIAQVWRSAAEARGRMLLVEKDYHETARLGADGYTLIIDDELENVRNRMEDAVDDIIEMVLKNGGDVVFVSDGALATFQRIAMVNRY